MGVKITPLLILNVENFKNLAGKKLVVDGCNLLFKYITKIRKNGDILYNKKGDPISHIIGYFYFIINLMERHIRPIFVFDGYPPEEKYPKSPLKIQRLVRTWQLYNKQKNNITRKVFYKDPLFLYDKIISDLQEFVRFMGCPVVRGLSEGEAQGARLVREGKAFGMISRDQDSLLFGCPRIFKDFFFKKETCTFYDLKYQLERYEISHRQLIDIAILIGTDFNEGIKGIGPKKALRLIQEYNQLENIPDFDYPFDIDRLRTLFLKPATIEVTPIFRAPNTKYLAYYLKNKGWNPRRIDRGIERLRVAFKQLPYKQASLISYI